MGWTLPHTIGNLHLLWYWALDFAPTGDLTKFDPDQLTQDLDLGSATPEQFVEAMIQSGFLDRSEDNVLRIHDWPDYTAKSLRPRFRRNPERWHQILRSYGLPVITRRTARRDTDASVQEQTDTSHASRNYQKVGMALRAVPREFPSAMAESETELAIALNSNLAAQHGGTTPPANRTTWATNAPGEPAVISEALASRPHFGAWWSRLLELYKDKGCPMTAHEQGKILTLLAEQPFSAVSMLKHSVKNFEASFAALPALAGIRPANTS